MRYPAKIVRVLRVACVASLVGTAVFLTHRYHGFQSWEQALGICAKILKYLGVATTTALSLFTLTRETVEEENDPNKPNFKRLTPEGRKYFIYLIISGLITIGASSLEDFTNSRITEKARLEGDQRLVAAIMANITPEFGKQGKRLSTAADSVEKLHGELNNTATELSKRVQESTEELVFSSMRFDHMYLGLGIVGFHQKDLPWTTQKLWRESWALVKSACIDQRQANKSDKPTKLWEPPSDDECGKTKTKIYNWARVVPFLRLMDPSGHLRIRLFLYFNAFQVVGEIDECDMPVGDTSSKYRCLRFDIERTIFFPSHLTPLLTGAPNLFAKEPGFSLQMPEHGWVEAFGDRAIYGRDMEPQTIGVVTCDKSSEKEQVAEQHVNRFQSKLRLRISFAGFEIENESGFWRSKVFAMNPQYTSTTGIGAHCRNYTYDAVPE